MGKKYIKLPRMLIIKNTVIHNLHVLQVNHSWVYSGWSDGGLFEICIKIAKLNCLHGVRYTLRSHQVPFAGDSLERSYLFYDWPSTLSSNAPAFRGQSRLSGFCCANGLCVRSPCHHNSRIHLMKTAARYQLRAQGRSFVPGPNKFCGITGRSRGERPHYEIAGESPARQTGPDVNAGIVTSLFVVCLLLMLLSWMFLQIDPILVAHKNYNTSFFLLDEHNLNKGYG